MTTGHVRLARRSISASQMVMLDRETSAANSATTNGSGQGKKMLSNHVKKRRRTRIQRGFMG